MISRTLRKIIEVPEAYNERNRSTGCLLEDIGFPEARELLKNDDVEQVLRDEPRLVSMWLKRGQDQRYSGGWGIECLGDQFHVVSFADGRKKRFSDPVKATAVFYRMLSLFHQRCSDRCWAPQPNSKDKISSSSRHVVIALVCQVTIRLSVLPPEESHLLPRRYFSHGAFLCDRVRTRCLTTGRKGAAFRYNLTAARRMERVSRAWNRGHRKSAFHLRITAVRVDGE